MVVTDVVAVAPAFFVVPDDCLSLLPYHYLVALSWNRCIPSQSSITYSGSNWSTAGMLTNFWDDNQIVGPDLVSPMISCMNPSCRSA